MQGLALEHHKNGLIDVQDMHYLLISTGVALTLSFRRKCSNKNSYSSNFNAWWKKVVLVDLR